MLVLEHGSSKSCSFFSWHLNPTYINTLSNYSLMLVTWFLVTFFYVPGLCFSIHIPSQSVVPASRYHICHINTILQFANSEWWKKFEIFPHPTCRPACQAWTCSLAVYYAKPYTTEKQGQNPQLSEDSSVTSHVYRPVMSVLLFSDDRQVRWGFVYTNT